MIQRIQSLWLFLTSLTLCCFYVAPLVHVRVPYSSLEVVMRAGNVSEYLNNRLLNTHSFWWVHGAIALLASLCLLVLLLYKNRKLQLQLSYLLVVLMLALCFVFNQAVGQVFNDLDLHASNYEWPALLPSVAIVFLLLAIKAIKKDDKLIRRANRLR